MLETTKDKKTCNPARKAVYLVIRGADALDFKRIAGKHSIRQDLAAVNPKHGTDDGYEYNCGNCVAAYELRRRGLDVEAQPRKRMPIDEWAGLFVGFQQQRPTLPMTADDIDIVQSIELDIILSWGDGARGTVYGVPIGYDIGHFFSVEVSDGTVMFVDSQTNKLDVRRYFDHLDKSSIVYGRLDNLEPDSTIINAVKTRGV